MNLNQYKDILDSYDQEQYKNNEILLKRREEIRSLIPEYETLEHSIASSAVSKVRMILSDAEPSATPNSDFEEVKRQTRIKLQNLLVSHGFASDYLDKIYTCKLCHDTGFINGQEKCNCFRQKIADSLYDYSGLGKLLETENFEHVNRAYFKGDDLANFEKNYQKSLDFVKNFTTDYRNLFFYGNVGTGKSFLSCCIAKELMDQGYQVVYYSANQLFEKLQLFRFSEDKLEALERIVFNCDLLILDDLAAEGVSEYVNSKLFSLLNERFIAKKSTIISSNLHPEQIGKHYSTRIFSRIVSQYDLLECKCSVSDIRIMKKMTSK